MTIVVGVVPGTSALAVTAAALASALATGLGALPLAFAKEASRSWLCGANAAAAILMLAASGMLFYQGARSDVLKTSLGAVVGVATIILARRSLRRRDHWRFEALRGAHARVAVLIVAVMTVHSVSEGVGIGVSFGGGRSIGFLTALAIAIHNIPEGLAISLVLVPRGVSVSRAAGWSVFSSLPQPVFALPAFLFVEAFSGALPVGLGFAAGAMTWMVCTELGLDLFPPSAARPGRNSVPLT